MSEREIQKILFIFGGGFLLGGGSMAYIENPEYSIVLFMLSALLIGVAAVGPNTIKTFGVSWEKGKFHIGFDRYEPTEQERKLALKLAQDKPSPEIEKEGEQFIEKAEQRTPEQRSPEDYLALATKKWRAKDYDAALADVFAGLALNPENIRLKATLIYRKGTIFYDLGLNDEAIKYFNKALELDLGFAWPHQGLGRVFSEQGKPEKSKEEYKKAIELDPKDSYPHNNLGFIFEKQGKLEEAKEKYEEALRLDPDNTQARGNLEKLKRKMKEGR